MENGAEKVYKMTERNKIIMPLYALVVYAVGFYLTAKYMIVFWMRYIGIGDKQFITMFVSLVAIEVGIIAYISWLCDWLYSKPLFKVIVDLVRNAIRRVRHDQSKKQCR